MPDYMDMQWSSTQGNISCGFMISCQLLQCNAFKMNVLVMAAIPSHSDKNSCPLAVF
jgi:hypothetical protein